MKEENDITNRSIAVLVVACLVTVLFSTWLILSQHVAISEMDEANTPLTMCLDQCDSLRNEVSGSLVVECDRQCLVDNDILNE